MEMMELIDPNSQKPNNPHRFHVINRRPATMEVMELIPGLTDDLARQCLIRLPFISYASLLSDFQHLRKLAGLHRPVFLLTQHGPPGANGGLFLFDPEPGIWTRLPPRPPSPNVDGFTINGILDIGSNKILTISSDWTKGEDEPHFVHIFDLLTGQWLRAADMPGPCRAFFGLVCDPTSGRVLVAGGHGGEFLQLAMRSALMYDMANDKWAELDNMENGRYRCSAAFCNGKLYALYAYFLSSGGGKDLGPEWWDPETRRWVLQAEQGFLEEGPGGCRLEENGDRGDWYEYSIAGGRSMVVRCRAGKEWEAATEWPEEIQQMLDVVAWKDKMVAWGIGELDAYYYYLLGLKSLEWTKLDSPLQHSAMACGINL